MTRDEAGVGVGVSGIPPQPAVFPLDELVAAGREPPTKRRVRNCPFRPRRAKRPSWCAA
ncbi:hypothetical protein OG863_40625 [Streptomyces decoyicus]|uniref:Uncharacterized protein n=1 Tax=Streptomyces decoyicus TaxID=249567 RepID=A0ABZ1FTD9_9ACTN|nr:hypothetical protein [Streptomyces decoyicus]WSB73734.1 hypothetical protein OG863_40625 [Streptomyces decoyicus]